MSNTEIKQGTPIPADLLRDLIRGDEQAWQKLEHELESKLFLHAKKLLKDVGESWLAFAVTWESCKKAIIGKERDVLYRQYFYESVRKAALKVVIKKTRERQRMRMVSLDQTSMGYADGAPLKDTIEAKDIPICSMENRELVERAMVVLSERERNVILCRVIEGLTQQVTADKLSLSLHQVIYAEREALKKMRTCLGREMGDSGVIQ